VSKVPLAGNGRVRREKDGMTAGVGEASEQTPGQLPGGEDRTGERGLPGAAERRVLRQVQPPLGEIRRVVRHGEGRTAGDGAGEIGLREAGVGETAADIYIVQRA